MCVLFLRCFVKLQIGTDLYSVMQARTCWMYGQIPKRLDVWLLPSVFKTPLNGEHVVGELRPKHQAIRIRFGFTRVC